MIQQIKLVAEGEQRSCANVDGQERMVILTRRRA
jgi:hypothetical protein